VKQSGLVGLGEHSGARGRAEPGEAGDDPGVWVLDKGLDGGLLEIISGGAGGVDLAQQGQSLTSYRLFHERALAHLRRVASHAAASSVSMARWRSALRAND